MTRQPEATAAALVEPMPKVELQSMSQERAHGAWIMALAGLLWLALASLLAASVWGKTLDDFFITYRYAWNLAHGNGFVFNPGERVFGTTAPGMGLLLAVAHGITGVSIPGLGTLSTAVALLAVALLLLHESRGSGRWPEALTGGTFLVACTYLWIQNGSEAPVALALLMAAAHWADRRPYAAGLLAGLAVWFRPDALVGVGCLGLLLWWERRRLPWAYGLAACALVAVGVLASWAWFGQPLPNTLAAKQFQAAWRPDIWQSGWSFWSEGFRNLRANYAGSGIYIFVVFGLVGQGMALRQAGRCLRLLAAYGFALTLAYPLLAVPFYPWYGLPEVMALVYGVALLGGKLVREVRSFLGATRVGLVTGLAATLALLLPWLQAVGWNTLHLYRTGGPSHRYEIYREAGLWLREHTRPGEDLTYVEVGAIAYFSQRPVRDLLGLVTPLSLTHVARGDMVGAFLEKPTSLVIYSTQLHGFIDPLRRQPWFSSSYQEVARFRHRKTGERLVVYRRREGTSLPPSQGPSPDPTSRPTSI